MSVVVQLPEAVLQLLPDVGASQRCADHARSIAVDPGGTAISAKAIILVETPRPWPKPVFDHQLLAGLGSTMDLHLGAARVLAAEPRTEQTTPRVTTYERGEVGAISNVFEPTDRDALLDLFDQFANEFPSRVTDHRSKDLAPELAVLVCTQGSHDICCGSDGVRFANDLELAAPGLAVFRVSHTGGHRFAPTAMTLPDGRMWANLDVAATLSILDLTGDAAELTARCRGWWGATTGPAQIAELAMLAEMGWDLDMLPREVDAIATDDGWRVDLTIAREPWVVDVIAGRVVPTIKCRAEGGLPAKQAQEYEVTAVRRQEK